MKKIIASLLITMLLLVGCGEQKHTKKVIPYSETYSVASENLTSSSNSKNETVKSVVLLILQSFFVLKNGKYMSLKN